jgi:putative acetyltransferase
MFLRTATLADMPQLKELYRQTILHINAQHYSPEQVSVWASTADRTEGLARRINEQHFYVTETNEGIITGFGSIEDSGYLDMLYVHKDYQRQGIGSQLIKQLLAKAAELGISIIESEVSITARPLFEHFGFVVVIQQKIDINGILLTNYKMKKHTTISV